MLTNNNNWASYAEGSLSKHGSSYNASGEVIQFFSDRRTSVAQNSSFFVHQLFSALATDKQRIWLYADGTIGFENLTWGGFKAYNPSNYQCSGNIVTIYDSYNSVILVNFAHRHLVETSCQHTKANRIFL